MRAALASDREAVVLELREDPIDRGTGAATRNITLLSGRLHTRDDRDVAFRLVRKSLEPLTTGPHAALAEDGRHWAYWRRELEAYSSGLLPTGPGLRAPRCVAVVGDELFLEVVEGRPPAVQQAAEHLAGWQIDCDDSLDRPWLATDQLGRRLDASRLDWSRLDADPRVVRLWDRRHGLLERLARLPRVLSHGDYSIGNLIDGGSETIALDWATVGWEPLGFDLAHLALSTGEDPTRAYVQAAPSSRSPELVNVGFGASAAIIGASRVHWMLSRGIDIPPWYVDFICGHAPA